MKRYAAHDVYISSEHVFKQHVVEIEKDIVVRLFPLNEEIESTVWLNGIILLSPLADYTLKIGSSFKDVLKDLCNQHTDILYAYYLSGIDLQTLLLSSSASLKRL